MPVYRDQELEELWSAAGDDPEKLSFVEGLQNSIYKVLHEQKQDLKRASRSDEVSLGTKQATELVKNAVTILRSFEEFSKHEDFLDTIYERASQR